MSDDDPQILIVGGRRGRPPLSPLEPSASVSVKLTVSDFDRVYKLAARHRVSVSEIMRRAVKHFASERGGILEI